MNTVSALAEQIATSKYERNVFRGIVVSTTGFYGTDRKLLKLLASLCHLAYSPSLVKSHTTHLICCSWDSSKRSEKINNANSWRIPCVELSWLIDSVTQCAPLSVETYVLKPYASTSSKDALQSKPDGTLNQESYQFVNRPSSVSSNAAVLDVQKGSSMPARLPLVSVENITSDLADVSISPVQCSSIKDIQQIFASFPEDSASPAVCAAFQHFVHGQDAAECSQELDSLAAQYSEQHALRQPFGSPMDSKIEDLPNKYSDNALSSFSSPAISCSLDAGLSPTSIYRTKGPAGNHQSDTSMAPAEQLDTSPCTDDPLQLRVMEQISSSYQEDELCFERNVSAHRQSSRDESYLLNTSEQQGTATTTTEIAMSMCSPTNSAQHYQGMQESSEDEIPSALKYAMSHTLSGGHVLASPLNRQSKGGTTMRHSHDQEVGRQDALGGGNTCTRQGIANWTDDDESEGFPTPLDPRHLRTPAAESNLVVVARPPQAPAVLPLTGDLTAVKLLKAAPRGNCVREHHGLATLKRVQFAEQVQVAAIGQVLSTKDKKTAVKLPAPLAMGVEVGLGKENEAAPGCCSLPAAVVLGEPVAFYHLPDGDWFLEYQQLYTAQQAQQLADALGRQLSLPAGFDHAYELLKSTTRQHARLGSIQGTVTVRRVKQGGTMLRLKGSTAVGGNFFWRSALDPATARCVTDRPAKDFVDTE